MYLVNYIKLYRTTVWIKKSKKVCEGSQSICDISVAKHSQGHGCKPCKLVVLNQLGNT